jgi:putative membrane protein
MFKDDRGLKVLFGILLATLVVAVLAGGSMMGPGMMGPGMMWGYGSGGAPPIAGSWGISMALGMLVMVAFWGALILGIVLLVRWAIGQVPAAGATPGAGDAVAILKRRYAAGEIDRQTYEQMKQELSE